MCTYNINFIKQNILYLNISTIKCVYIVLFKLLIYSENTNLIDTYY